MRMNFHEAAKMQDQNKIARLTFVLAELIRAVEQLDGEAKMTLQAASNIRVALQLAKVECGINHEKSDD